MKDELICFETAKIAKEKGFDESCRFVFENDKEKDLGYIQRKNSTYPNVFTRPTQTTLQKWLRDIHEIDVVAIPVRFTGHLEIGYWTYSVKSIQPVGKQKYKFNTYEDALEIGLQEALKLI